MKLDISYTEDGMVISKMELIPQDVWNVDVTAAFILGELMDSFINLNRNKCIPARLEMQDAIEYCRSDEEREQVTAFFKNNQHWNDTVVVIWERMLEHMRDGFKTYKNYDEDEDSPKNVRLRRGRELFFQYFESLWD
jgi:hypothetical protein